LAFLVLFIVSLPSLIITFYIADTETAPAVGGGFTEGLVGSPRFINPLYAVSNDADRDLTELIFSGIMKYGPEGEVVYDLAEMVEVKEGGREYEVYLKENVFWHDGEKLTADDVIFTLDLLKNSEYKSPLRGNYIGIEAEKKSDRMIALKINDPYAGFEERLTFKILPEHIWQDISPQNFFLSDYNLQPVGSGPYQFKELVRNGEGSPASLKLARFKNYFGTGPYLKEINFRFFASEEELIKEIKAGRIDGFSLSKEAVQTTGFKLYSFTLPRHFAVFLNIEESDLLAEKTIRQALNYATDKEALLEGFFSNRGEIMDYYPFDQKKAEELLEAAGLEKKQGKWFEVIKGNIVEFRSDLQKGNRGSEVTALQTCLDVSPTGYFGSQTEAAVIAFQEKYAEEILDPWGFNSGTGIVAKTTRAKLNEVCSEPAAENELAFTLITVEDPVMKEVAEEIARQWKEIGIGLTVKTYALPELKKDFIKPRSYETLLSGQIWTIVEDPLPFWHSSQKKDPGLNLSKYDNSKADLLLEQARTALDQEEREEKLQEFREILVEDAPAVFLFNPDYLYWISEKIVGVEEGPIVDLSKRFTNINEWYIKTKRTWK